MDQETPAPKVADGAEAPQGCMALWGAMGLAAYAGLLLTIILVGVLGLMSASIMAVFADADSGAELMSGVEASSWRLSELRRANVLAPGEVPALYHDHSARVDGSAGCLVIDDRLIRWEGWAQEATARIGARAEVSTEGDPEAPTVTLRGADGVVSCAFSKGQGGDRLIRMLNAEIRRAPEAP